MCSPFLLDFLYLEQVLKVERNAFVSKIYIRNKFYKKKLWFCVVPQVQVTYWYWLLVWYWYW